jgi:hypothetical protein
LVRLAERRRGGDYVHVVFPNVELTGGALAPSSDRRERG